MASDDKSPSMSVGRFVLLTDIVGVLAAALVLTATWGFPAPDGTTPAGLAAPAVYIGFALLAALGQLAYVRVSHGTTHEELTFFEIVLAAGMVLLPPAPLLMATLVGVLIAEVVIRRPAIRVAYNLGSYAASTSAMLASYLVLGANSAPLDLQSTIAMVVAMIVFTVVNLLFIAKLLSITASAAPLAVISQEWKLSAFMAVGGAGVGMVAVALYLHARPLLPFAMLPAVALWYAYRATAQHANARERNRWLIILGGALAQHGRGENTLDQAAEAVRQVVGAPEMRVIRPETRSTTARELLLRVQSKTAPTDLHRDELPNGWTNGIVTPLDLSTDSRGAILLGSTEPPMRSRITRRTRGWSLDEADAPVLGALVAALGSSLTAGAAFDALEEETAKLTAVVDNTSDGIAMIDDAGRIRLWSQTMARMTGVEGALILPVEVVADMPAVVQALVRTSWAARDAGGGALTADHVHLVRPDGEELDVLVSTVRVAESTASADVEGGGWVSILTVHDETRERRVERMKTDFIATISHELRTPITPIKGYAHLLATRGDRVPPAKRQAALETISDRADHLARLVDDLLLASRVSDGARLAVEIGLEDLQDVITTAVGMFPHMSDRIAVAPLPAPITVQCDRVRAVQCLSNLIGNAGKYTPPETVVEVSVVATALQVAIHVRDHGPGIPPAEQARVFERFYRIEDPFTMKTGGAGLGLHIARELAVAMGGGLSLETPPGGGADFVLHLVTAEAPPVGKAAGASQAQIAPAAGRDGHPGRGDTHPGVSSGGVRGPAGGMGRVQGATIHPADQ